MTELKNLVLNLNGVYFDEIKSLVKLEEYRLCTPYWEKRLLNKSYDQIIIKRGYPKSGDIDREIKRKYKGWQIKTITHPHFGEYPVKVFAIIVN